MAVLSAAVGEDGVDVARYSADGDKKSENRVGVQSLMCSVFLYTVLATICADVDKKKKKKSRDVDGGCLQSSCSDDLSLPSEIADLSHRCRAKWGLGCAIRLASVAERQSRTLYQAQVLGEKGDGAVRSGWQL
ncbi:hypothetical protein CBR_g71673 [Chara braunii]|uniref:Uncharacterized protein n=1 Tax=Chara braunii TaxID=69332 RepID=A0A388MG75_CHABU|nr:hypothetical protein CBR_g71673 [Chara braunii]|eukprot:GBG93489.1 hypothetical protein CBR_g71673 [Chara braunii]